MAKLKIGKLPVYKGEYQDDINYSRLNQVSYLGTTFQSLTDDNIGHPPAELSEDGGEIIFINTNYWSIIAKGSEYNDNRVATNSNKGYKILKKNKSFAEQVTEENTIYEIRYDFTLEKNITIPANCILKFNGGTISGEHIITGNNTGINAELFKIFNIDVTLAGSWNISEIYPEWFGAKGDGVTDDAEAINKSINLQIENNLNVILSSKTYLVSPDIIIFKRHNVRLAGNNAKIVTKYNDNEHYYRYIIGGTYNECGEITIENIIFDNIADNVFLPANNTSDHGRNGIIGISCDNLLIKNNTIYFYGTNAICNLSYNKNIRIENNNLYFTRKGDRYDSSALYINNAYQKITGNYICGKYNSEDEMIWGGIESHGDSYLVSENTIEYCLNGINLTNNDNYMSQMMTSTGHEAKIVSNNTINNCTHGIIIWPFSGSKGIYNLQITNNNINLHEKGGTGIGINQEMDGIIDNLIIANNQIERISGTPVYPYNWMYYGLINFPITDNIKNIFISGNSLINAARCAIFIKQSDNATTVNKIKIVNNIFKDCSIYNHNGENGNYYYAGYDVIFAKNINDLVINNNSFVFDKSISLLNNLVSLSGSYNTCEILRNIITCNYIDTTVQNYKEQMSNCSFDITKIKTDLPAYIDLMPVENRVYQEKTYIGSGIPVGKYHKGDKIIDSTKITIFKGVYTNPNGTSAGYLPTSLNKRVLSLYNAGLPLFSVGDAIYIDQAIGGPSVKHTISKIVGKNIWFSEDIELTDTDKDSGSVGGFKEEKVEININA